MNHGYAHREHVSREFAGRAVIAHLCIQYPHSNAVEWGARLARGEVTLDGVVARGEEILGPGQSLVWNRPAWEEPEAPLELEVLHEDETLVAIAKPPGLPTLPGAGYLEHTVLGQLRRRFPDAVPAHRLGRWTSGVVICPRTPEAAATLLRDWSTHRVQKIYVALASGCLEREAFDVTTPIGPVPYPPLGTVHAASDSGKPALSGVRVLDRRPEGTLVEVNITTGRPHQIRIHLAAAGHPLVGDPLYAAGGRPLAGGNAVPGDPGYQLHAWRVVLCHPRTGKALTVTAPPPSSLQFRGTPSP